MTNKEAVEWIERIIILHQVEDMNVTLTDRREYEALDLAIKALELQDKLTDILAQAVVDSGCEDLDEFCEKCGMDISEGLE